MLFVRVVGIGHDVADFGCGSIYGVTTSRHVVFTTMTFRVSGRDIVIGGVANTKAVGFANLIRHAREHGPDGRTMRDFLPSGDPAVITAEAPSLVLSDAAMSWTLPGFRRRRPWHMLGAIVAYAAIALTFVPVVRTPFAALIYALAAGATVAMATDDRGVQSGAVQSLRRRNRARNGVYVTALTMIACVFVWMVAVLLA